MSESGRLLDVTREEVAHEHVVVCDTARAAVVPTRRLRAVRDDEVVAAAAKRVELSRCRNLEALARERLSVGDSPRVGGLRAAQQLPHGRHARFGSALRLPDPVELGRALHPPAVVEETLVDVERDPCAAQPVGVRQREGRRHDRVRQADVLGEAEADLGEDRVQVDALRDELFGLVGLEGLHLDGRCHALDVVEVERDDAHESSAIDFRIRERVADGHGNLVAQLERALAVTDQQHVRHSAAR